jgi:undecaprenyl-diphosphatase
LVTNRTEGTRSGIGRHPVLVTAAFGVVGWVLLVGVALALGVVVTNLVVGHTLGHGDLDVARWFAERRTSTWNTVSVVGSGLGGTITVVVVAVLAVTVLALRRCWPQCGLLVVAMAAEGGVYLVSTALVSRNRPPVVRLEDLILADSYPSGHTAAATALYGSLCIIVWSLTRSRGWRTFFMMLAIAAPVAVATARVYRGMHNVTDVVCGLALGAGCIAVGYVAARASLAAGDERRAGELHREFRSSPAGLSLEEVAS